MNLPQRRLNSDVKSKIKSFRKDEKKNNQIISLYYYTTAIVLRKTKNSSK